MPRKTNKSKKSKAPKRGASPLRKVAAVVIMLLSVLSALPLLVASYVQYLSPNEFPLLALLGLAFPIFALSTILLFLILLVLYPRYSLLPLVALLLAIPAMRQYCPINRGNDRLITNKPGFSMLSYNVYHFNDVEKELYPDIEYNRTLQNIINIDADIVALQETVTKFPLRNKRYNFSSQQLEQLNNLYPYQIYQNRLHLLSKYPVHVVSDTTFTKTALMSVFEVDVDGRKLTILNNHLQSIGFTQDDKELYVELTSAPDSIENKVGGIKVIGRKLLDAFTLRASQAEAVDSIARSIDGNVIICGDINDTPNSYAYRTLAHSRRDAFLELGSGPGYTYLADRMWVRIDYIIYQGDMDARYIKVEDKHSSDHYPIYAEFEWK